MDCDSGHGCSGMEGALRLMDGEAGPGYEYGRLEIFLRGFWSNICDSNGFTPQSARVACTILGYDGGASLDVGEVWQVTHSFARPLSVLTSAIMHGSPECTTNCTFRCRF